MPIAANFTSKLQQNWEITFLQCYPNGYLKYTDLCNILQLTAGFHAELGGISFSDMQAHHQAWVLSRMRVEIKRLPKWKETVTVKTWINSLENSRSIRCLEMYIGDEKIIGCETFWAVFNTKTRRPESLALPHEHFEKYTERATEKMFGKIDFQHEMQTIGKHKVKLSDLDIVNHANSVKYLEWCLDCVDVAVIQNQKIESFEMNYLKEVSLNDKVEIKQKVSEDHVIFAVEREEKTCFALQLWLK
ncbi:acyl-[acyl-carrier-protein] thioesterase [Flavobacterium sp. IMCC34852]|uniref:Acyl-[acyl-carrier-protein] thioesterase n=1 Tax=Flavobacterium rivulicola TaxID=2732161 RepID=A0A7Y3RAI3_9FLAO|nr:acyl-ACP thioesterase domain-containing protein [Flavobacterium sp. IMCC34852]NNT72939.1 acyl-[acyl-carrier-protein] thioesterase [Flavobacterium sp. IMCC34852]